MYATIPGKLLSAYTVLGEFKRLFVDPSGDYYAAVRAFVGACVLNPLVAVNMDMEEMTHTIEDLSYFGFLMSSVLAME